MRNIIGAVLALALLAPGAASAAEATGVVESWDSGKRLLTLKLGLTEPHTFLGCTFAQNINVPPSLSKGRNVVIVYTGQGAGLPAAAANNSNQCSQLQIQ